MKVVKVTCTIPSTRDFYALVSEKDTWNGKSNYSAGEEEEVESGDLSEGNCSDELWAQVRPGL